MRRHMCSRAIVLALILTLAATVVGCGGPRAGETPVIAPSGPRAAGREGPPAGVVGESSQEQLAELGVRGRYREADPRGLQVTGFVESSEPWPLEVVGVEAGDVIVSCNGEKHHMGARLAAALEALQDRGEAITLEVIRDGEEVVLTRAEAIPAAETQ